MDPAYRHGTLEIKYYAPRGIDGQQPHRRDELYVIHRGRALFVVDGVLERNVEPGDTIFVAAGHPHRFAGMSHDFGTWVFFYGPEGGEPA